MKLILSPRFAKDLEKLVKRDSNLTLKVEKTLINLQESIFYPSLRFHKLSGTNNWSVSVDMRIRIILHIDESVIYLLRIGSHDSIY